MDRMPAGTRGSPIASNVSRTLLASEMQMSTVAAILSLDGCSDAELARRMSRGETIPLELVMRRNNRLLYRVARSILRDDAEAEDCLQEAYLQAYRASASFRADAKLSTWLTRIVINQALERLRKRKREGGNVSLDNVIDMDRYLPEADATLEQPEQPEAAAHREEVRRLLESKIDRLPAAFRMVFVLRALEDLSVEETAAVLGVPEATVRSRFFRARGLLREALEREVDLAYADAFGFDGWRCDRIVAVVLDRLKHPASGPGS
jgi:RNA polymerase sigma-70 factor, ECF subfamily